MPEGAGPSFGSLLNKHLVLVTALGAKNCGLFLDWLPHSLLSLVLGTQKSLPHDEDELILCGLGSQRFTGPETPCFLEVMLIQLMLHKAS